MDTIKIEGGRYSYQ